MKVLYVNGMQSRGVGEAFLAGVRAGLGEGVEIIEYPMGYGDAKSPRLMGVFARASGAEAVILSGSEKNTTDLGDPWVRDYIIGLKDLLDYRDGDLADWQGPSFAVLGICFGHQAIACAFGGETARFERLCGRVGLRALPRARSHALFRKLVADAGNAEIEARAVHADHVIRVPEEFHPVLTSDYCVVQAMAHRQWPIVSFQAHPEITALVKHAPGEEGHWEALSNEDMDRHCGPAVLQAFREWAKGFTR